MIFYEKSSPRNVLNILLKVYYYFTLYRYCVMILKVNPNGGSSVLKKMMTLAMLSLVLGFASLAVDSASVRGSLMLIALVGFGIPWFVIGRAAVRWVAKEVRILDEVCGY